MSESKGPRSVQKDAQLTFLGVMTVLADIMPTKGGDKTPETKLACPVLDEATPMKQVYIVDGRLDLGQWTVGDCHRAMEVGDKLVKITDEELKAMRTPTLPSGECDFKVFPLADVQDATIQSGTTYLIKPKKMAEGSRSQQSYAMLVDLVADAERQGFAFIGEMTLKSVQRMYRCIVRKGNLLLQELVRPDEVLPPIEFPTGYDGRLLEAAGKMIAAQVEVFDPSKYGSEVKERARVLAEQIAAGGEREVPVAPQVKSEEEADDLLALLTASIPDKPAAKTRKRATKAAAA